MLFRWRFFIVFIFIFFFFGFGGVKVSAQFSGGIGTSESPYQISNCTELQNIGSSDSPGSFAYMDDYFVLINNIDCSETETWNQDVGETYFGFDPIYYYDENTYAEFFFSGFLDGQNFTIDGLYINRPDEYDAALFGYTADSTIINLNLTNVNITGAEWVGGIASYMEDVTIRNLSVTGRLVSLDQDYGSVGGIVSGIYFTDYSDPEIIIDDCHFSGDIVSGKRAGGIFSSITLDEGVTDAFTLTITNSSSSGSIDVGNSGMEAGGLVGNNSFVNITNSNSSMNISGNSKIGGLVGINESGEMENCYSTGTINGVDSDVGGLIGYNNNGRILKSYSESQVSGNVYVGGLIGSNHSGHVENTYATGDVSGIVVGGLIGFNSIDSASGELNTVINSYASGTVTGIDTDGAVGGLIGYSTSDAIYNSYSVGEVLGVGGSGFGGFVGVFEYDVFLGQSPSDLLFNNGWYKPEDTLLNAIGILIEYNSDTYEYNEIGSTSVSNEVSDYTEFYSRSHQIYDVGVSFPWDFTTPIWYEWTNTYPLFIPQPLETPTPTPTLTPTPTGTVLGTTTNSSGGLPVCTDLPPVLAPNLFQITAEKNGARLYYTPIVGQVDGYTITYGYFEGDERWAVIAPVINNNQGVQSYRVGSLEAGKTYYFKVSAKHGCQVGPWSAWLSAKQGGVLAATSGVGELPKAGLIFPTIVLVLGSFISLLGIVILKSRT